MSMTVDDCAESLHCFVIGAMRETGASADEIFEKTARLLRGCGLHVGFVGAKDAEFARETIIKLICKPPLKSKGDELTADLRRVLALLGEK